MLGAGIAGVIALTDDRPFLEKTITVFARGIIHAGQ